MKPDGIVDVEQDPIFGFRPARRRAANHPESRVRTLVVAVGDEDLDWIDYKVQTYSVPDAEDRTTYTTLLSGSTVTVKRIKSPFQDESSIDSRHTLTASRPTLYRNGRRELPALAGANARRASNPQQGTGFGSSPRSIYEG